MKTRYIYILLAAVVITSSCEKNVEIDIEEIAPMIVMNGVLASGEDVSIFLSRTRHILDNAEITPLINAEVTITNEDGQTDSLVIGEYQIYRTGNMEIIPGKSYTVTANAPGYNEASATATIPEPVPIRSMDTISRVNEWGDNIYDFEMTFEDVEGESNFYMISITATYENAWMTDTYIYDTLYVDPEKDTVVTGYRLEIVENRIVQNEAIWFESENLAIEQRDRNQGRLLFSDRLFDGKRYTLTGTFNTWFLYQAADTVTLYYSLHSIDNDYYKYIDTRADHYYAQDDPFAVPVVVHNNIENGIGILGGMSVYTDSMKLAPRNYNWEDPRYY